MKQPHTPLNEDLLTRWIDGQLTPEEAALIEQQAAQMPELRLEKEHASQLGLLLRTHLPASQEPPSPEFFTSSIMEEIRRELPAARPAVRKSKLPACLRWLEVPWIAPLASAAAVAVGFMLWNHAAGTAPGTGGGLLAQTYTPDPRITASAWYSEEAEATVIDLQNLDAVPDDREIKAFDVASAEPAHPGEPTVLYAAGTQRPVMVLSKDARDNPRITTLQ